MKLVTFVHRDSLCMGVLQTGDGQEWVIDLNQADLWLPRNIIEFLQAGAEALRLAGPPLARVVRVQRVARSLVVLKAPFARPGKIIGVLQNYLSHGIASGAFKPPFPVVFAKYARANANEKGAR
jgi:2-keto-4-pentenoate hydratase/2-oxohepta-3-ene-1,7-dioic acid hydratase in catechol pathway